jgi:hypothetical protein
LTHCGHSLDAVFRLTADGSNLLVALKRSGSKSWTDWRPHDHEELAAACAFRGCRHAGSDRTGGRTCVRERTAMVETIRAYARSDASILGQQGLSERVLQAMGQTKRHLFILSDLAPSHTRRRFAPVSLHEQNLPSRQRSRLQPLFVSFKTFCRVGRRGSAVSCAASRSVLVEHELPEEVGERVVCVER